MDIFSSTTIPVLEQTVNFAQARHNVLAGNVANLDTPGYHVRDLSPQMFQAKLKQAIANRDQMRQPISGGEGLSPGSMTSAGFDPVSQMSRSVSEFLHHDDTNASLEGQVMAIAKNELQHNVAMSILTSQFRLLSAAITERA